MWRLDTAAFILQVHHVTKLCSALLLTGVAALAQPVPKLTTLSREWLQRGTTNHVVVEGENLSGVTGFFVSGHPGLTAARAAAPRPTVTLQSSAGGIAPAGDDDKQLTALVVVAPDASLEARELRAVSPTGVSNPLLVQVSAVPELIEQEPNNATNQAQSIELPVGLSGVLHEAAELDTFRFVARQGQRLLFDVQADRRGSPLDASLVVLDAAGRELARGEDEHGLDAFIEFRVPADAEYSLQLRDFRYQGGSDYKYRLVAGELPYLDGLFPFGARRGQTVEVALRGRNLDGADKLRLTIAEEAPLGPQEVRLATPKGVSNALRFDVGEAPEFLETEPNDTSAQANAVSLPVTINGHVGAPHDVDAFKFQVERGRTYRFEVLAQRFGSPLDALLTLHQANGAVLQRNDDAAGADARIEQRFDPAGEYVISVRDLLERGGEDFGYRLTVRELPPDFTVSVLDDTPRLHRGAFTSVGVEVNRRAGFDGAVEITCENLPDGVRALPLLIPPELPGGELFLAAAPAAEPGHFRFQVAATGVIDGKKIRRLAQPKSGGREVKEAFLTVLEAAPFAVEPLTLSASVSQGESTTVEALLTRRADFTGEVRVAVEGFSAGREPISRSVATKAVTLQGNAMRARLDLTAKMDSEVGTRPAWFKAEAEVDGRTVRVLSQPFLLTIAPFPFTLATSLPRVSVTVPPPGVQSPAAEAEFSIKTERRGWFTDDIALELEGVPGGITATSTNLPRGSTEAVIRLIASENAAAGTNTLTIVGTAHVNGREFRHRASIALIVSPPAEQLAAGVGPPTK